MRGFAFLAAGAQPRFRSMQVLSPDELVDAVDDERGAWVDVHVAELARHLPGMAPAIRLLWAHVIDERVDAVGTCCADGGPIEP